MGRFLKRFDFIACDIEFRSQEKQNEPTEKRGRKKRTERASNRQCHIWRSGSLSLAPIQFALWLPISDLSLSLSFSVLFVLRFPFSCSSLFSISRSGGGRLHSHRMANWTRNFILPDEKPPRPEKVGKVSGRMQYSRRPGRQRMSSAHESGYPNEIQYGNVEDHSTVFTRVSLPLFFPFIRSLSCYIIWNITTFFANDSFSIWFRRIRGTLPVAL